MFTLTRLLGFALMLGLSQRASADPIVPRSFEPPPRTEWAAKGCRAAPASSPGLPARNAWRNLHGDEFNSDEVSVALAPVFHAGWTRETETWNPTGPVFDSAGNLYFAPLLPIEDVVLISLEAKEGERRFAVPNTTGAPSGSGAPMILEGSEKSGEEIVYLGLYDRALAIRTDGTEVWDVPTGLPSDEPQNVFGVNYHPQTDAIVGLTRDGFIYVLDRDTGAPLLATPHQLPGDKSPPSPPSSLPGNVRLCVAIEFGSLIDSAGGDPRDLQDLLLGNNTEVANHFSIDARTGRIWIAATAPDAEDGTEDGVSAYGALFRLELIQNGPTYEIREVCHASFIGGSASTPSLSADGSRIYVGDNSGRLVAIEAEDCSRAWALDVDSQIFGSIGVSSHNDELYAATQEGVVQVIDEGDSARVRWTADIDAFEFNEPGLINMNLNLVSIGANGIYVQIGAGFPPNLVLTTGIGHLDRDTGAIRSFAPGLEETVAVMSTGADGAIYLGNSPLRRIVANCSAAPHVGLPTIPFGGEPLLLGIRKFEPERLDLLIRDATCAGEARADNAWKHRDVCEVESANAEAADIQSLIDQAQRVAPQAIGSGDLDAHLWRKMNKNLERARAFLNTSKPKRFRHTAKNLGKVCRAFD